MNLMHAHIYFEGHHAAMAQNLYAAAANRGFVKYHKIYPTALGPHPLPTIELHFDELDFDTAKAWLDHHRQNLSVLLHYETGHDVRDHQERITWLGRPLPLDFGFFELILRHPELKIHPDSSPRS